MGWTYALPVVGKYAYNWDRIEDLSQMERDFAKNTGRKVKYQTNSYQARAFQTMGSVAEDLMRDVGRTVRWL